MTAPDTFGPQWSEGYLRQMGKEVLIQLLLQQQLEMAALRQKLTRLVFAEHALILQGWVPRRQQIDSDLEKAAYIAYSDWLVRRHRSDPGAPYPDQTDARWVQLVAELAAQFDEHMRHISECVAEAGEKPPTAETLKEAAERVTRQPRPRRKRAAPSGNESDEP